MALQTKKWDVVDFLNTREDLVAYLDAALEENDAAFFAKALGDVARSHGMTQIAKTAGVSRESLYKALSVDGNPEFATIMKVMSALGLHMTIEPADKAA